MVYEFKKEMETKKKFTLLCWVINPVQNQNSGFFLGSRSRRYKDLLYFPILENDGDSTVEVCHWNFPYCFVEATGPRSSDHLQHIHELPLIGNMYVVPCFSSSNDGLINMSVF